MQLFFFSLVKTLWVLLHLFLAKTIQVKETTVRSCEDALSSINGSVVALSSFRAALLSYSDGCHLQLDRVLANDRCVPVPEHYKIKQLLCL